MNIIENDAPRFSKKLNEHITVDKAFQSICFYGEHFLFGLVQGRVIKRLYEEGKTGHPYIHFNLLLSDVGCKSMYMGDLFKANPDWKKIIYSPGGGFYRLHEDFFREGIVKKEDKIEKRSQLSKREIIFDKNFYSLYFQGEVFYFGVKQARIMKMLYRAGKSDRPYILSHILLTRAGCKSLHIRDVFKSKPHWKKIIHAGGNGYYRLNRAFFEEYERDQRAA